MPKIRRYVLLLVLVLCAGTVLPSMAAQVIEKMTLYQSDFSQNPDWTTNSPTRYYWDPTLQMYHFKTEGGTNGYSFYPVQYDGQSFTLDYDVIIASSGVNSAFRFGLISSEMDFSRGTNILSCFENGKYGPIMSLRVIDQSNMLREATSYYTSYCGQVPGCDTVPFQENTTYHVTVKYNKELQNADIKVTEKETGKLVWGYFVSVGRDLYFMDRLAITTKGDYAFGPFSEGYIDNVELIALNLVEVAPATPVPEETTPHATAPPTAATTIATMTPTPTASPLPVPICIAAAGIPALLVLFHRRRE